MITQTLIHPAMTCNFAIALRETSLSPESPIHASAHDYGFDFDEEELGNELLAPLPISVEDQPIPEVDADEFEKVFQYFSS